MSDQEAETNTTVEMRDEAQTATEEPGETPEDAAPKELAIPEGVTMEAPVEPDWNVVEFPIELFGNRIAIKRDDIADRTDGGLFLPESARHSKFRTMVGTCVGVSKGILKADGTHGPMPIKVGDRVVFEKFRSMVEITVNGFMYHTLNWTDLMGRLKRTAHAKTEEAEEVVETRIS